ncbi:protein FAM107A-like [Limulus polyphemus]|uniref:Protein FAM107A-like n=1 Tax=Limulus polyphemus TaxID=6850 RepID=A0ABM1BDJ7_LIMPO|nr:protein FAM107A-like [Limulus polyphemus]
MLSEAGRTELEEQELCSSCSMSSTNGVKFPEEDLVVPKKLPNPCQESVERKSVHRELLFNYKIGKNVLGQKSELQKAMEKVKDDQKKKEMDQLCINKRSSLEKRLEAQADKLQQHEEKSNMKTEATESEFHQVHSKVCPQVQPVESNS